MKRIATGLLTAAILAGLATPAVAADQNPYGRDSTASQPYRHVIQATEKQVQPAVTVTPKRAR